MISEPGRQALIAMLRDIINDWYQRVDGDLAAIIVDSFPVAARQSLPGSELSRLVLATAYTAPSSSE